MSCPDLSSNFEVGTKDKSQQYLSFYFFPFILNQEKDLNLAENILPQLWKWSTRSELEMKNNDGAKNWESSLVH